MSDVDELVKRLRAKAKSQCRREEGEDWRDMFDWQVADTLTALQAENERLREALEAISSQVSATRRCPCSHRKCFAS